MLLIYTPKVSNRLGYTANVIFHTILRFDYQLTTDLDTFLAHQGPRLAYGGTRVQGHMFIHAAPLLFETSIAQHQLDVSQYNGHATLFSHTDDSDLPFDPLAASFFMLSRYEEYLPHPVDAHGRFPAAQSVAFQHGFLLRPVVDLWARDLFAVLRRYYGDKGMPVQQYKMVNTVDIDATYCYRCKGLVRNILGMLHDIYLHHDLRLARQRLRVLRGKEQDPFDTFDTLLDVRRRYPDMRLIFFSLLADYGPYDRPIPYTNRQQRQLLQHLCDFAKLGIHCSYGSLEKPELIQKESKRLSDIIHRPIVRNRFHFLRFSLPDSYHYLLDNDIWHDYSMGYAEEPGFRAGTCVPFHFFDLTVNQELQLTVHPFAAMDTTWHRYKNASLAEASQVYRQLLDEATSLHTTLNILWHNQNLSNQNEWEGWQQLFELTAQSTEWQQ